MEKEIFIFLISMLPIWELRGSIPLALHVYNLSPLSAFFWSFAGNFLVGILLVYLLDPIVNIVIERIKPIKKIYDYFAERVYKKHRKKVELYAELAIFFIVALPLPGTGAWTGALASRVFRLNKLWSILSIGLGLIACGIIVLALSTSANVLSR